MPEQTHLIDQTITRQHSRLNTALLIALIPVTAAAVRIWVYSGGDNTLFLVLLRTINIPAVLIGTMILMIPSLLTIFAVVALMNLEAGRWTKRKLSEHRFVSNVLFPASLIVIGYTLGWKIFVVLALSEQ
jgi:hypothetical protein